MPTTSRLALPYPTPDDDPLGPAQIQALAERLDSVVVVPDAGDLKFSARVNEHGAWIKADGRALGAGVYPTLRAALIADGSPYGNDAGNPRVPDLRGRAPVGAGGGPGLTARANGQAGGAEAHPLTTAELAAHKHAGATGLDANNHTHSVQMSSGPGGLATYAAPGNGNFAGNWPTSGYSTAHSHPLNMDDAGGGQAHPNMQPFTVGTWFVYAG